MESYLKKLHLKSSFFTVLLFFATCVLIYSCKEDVKPQKGSVNFSFDSKSTPNGRTAQSANFLVVSIKDQHGNFVLERKKMELFKFGQEYISEPLALGVGNFTLTEFLVLDVNNQVLYATPVEGSALAHLVADPLPVNFSVTKDHITKVTAQVVAVDAGTSLDFGYSTFTFNVVETFHFRIGVLVYDELLNNFKLTTSTVNISQNGTNAFTGTLPAATHLITLKDNNLQYLLKIEKTDYQSFEKTFTIDELKQFKNSVLVVKLIGKTLDNGLIANYNFSGNALDQTANHYNGIVHGATLTTDRNGVANSAYSFNGTDNYISVPHNDAFNFAGSDFSVSVWVQASAIQNSSNSGIDDIIRKWNGDAQGYPFSISFLDNNNASTQNKILFVRYDGSGCANAPTVYSPSTFNSNFHHLVFMKKATKIYMYIDGIMVAEAIDTASCSVSNTADVTIGRRGNDVRHFTGKIDDIRFYNRALTDAEVGSLAHL